MVGPTQTRTVNDVFIPECCCNDFALGRFITEDLCVGIADPVSNEPILCVVLDDDFDCKDEIELLPDCYKITVEGVTAGDLCDNCDAWNREFILHRFCDFDEDCLSNYCYWVSAHPQFVYQPELDFDCIYNIPCSPSGDYGMQIGIASMWLQRSGGLRLTFYSMNSFNDPRAWSFQQEQATYLLPYEDFTCFDNTGTGNTNTFTFLRESKWCPNETGQSMCTNWPLTIELETLAECPPAQDTTNDLCAIDDINPCGDCPIPCTWVVFIGEVTNDSCSGCDQDFNKGFFLKRNSQICRWESKQCSAVCNSVPTAYVDIQDPNPETGTGTGSNSTTAILSFWIEGDSGEVVRYATDEIEMPMICSRGIVASLVSHNGDCQDWPTEIVVLPGHTARAEQLCWEFGCEDSDNQCRGCDCDSPDEFEVTITGLDVTQTVCDEYNSTYTFTKTADPCRYETSDGGELIFKADSIEMTFDVGFGTVAHYGLLDCVNFNRNCYDDILMAYTGGGSYCSGWPSTLTLSQP